MAVNASERRHPNAQLHFAAQTRAGHASLLHRLLRAFNLPLRAFAQQTRKS